LELKAALSGTFPERVADLRGPGQASRRPDCV